MQATVSVIPVPAHLSYAHAKRVQAVEPPALEDVPFGFAKVGGSYCLVQTELAGSIDTFSSNLKNALVEVNIYRHEFGTMFRLSRTTKVRAVEVQLLLRISSEHVIAEESGVVFVAKGITDKMVAFSAAAVPSTTSHSSPYAHNNFGMRRLGGITSVPRRR